MSTDATTPSERDSDRTLVANFTELPHTLTVSASPEEGGTVDGGGEYASDSYVAGLATPNAGYASPSTGLKGDVGVGPYVHFLHAPLTTG